MKTVSWLGFVSAILTVIFLLTSVYLGFAIIESGVPVLSTVMFMVVMVVWTVTAITEIIKQLRQRSAQQQAGLDAAWDKLCEREAQPKEEKWK